MILFAVTVMEKLHALPRKNLINLGLAILVLIVVVLLIKQAARMNRFILLTIVLVTLFVIMFTWVYQRNEPKFLTPFVDEVAPFFPSKPKSHW